MSREEPAAPTLDRESRPDWLLLCLAVGLLVAPAWWRGPEPVPLEHRSGGASAVRLDVNTAPAHHFSLLRGIGERRAHKIIEIRQQRGGFRSFAELRDIPGLPTTWLEDSAPYLSLGGETLAEHLARERVPGPELPTFSPPGRSVDG